MRIDAHQHFWEFNPQRDTWITEEMSVLRRDFLPEDLSRELASQDFEACVAVQADQSEKETFYLLDLARRFPFVVAVVGWVDLQADNVAERLDHFASHSQVVGFRHIAQAEPDDRFLVRAEHVRGIRALATHGFTYDLLVYPHQLEAAVDLVEKFPDQKFVLDHIGKPRIKARELGEWPRLIRRLAQNKNVYCKVSGLVTEADWKSWKPADFQHYLDVVFEAFGLNRLMFGSDWPVCLLAADYAQVVGVVAAYIKGLGSSAQAAIMGENAARFYGIKVPAVR